jgi:glycosyltransferase involved in cell wall biosynthesis
VVVGVPEEDPSPAVGGIDADRVHPLRFGRPPIDFALPGMSDVMPYRSSRFSDLGEQQIAAYRTAWCDHVRPIIVQFKPQVIHSHHVWLLSALLKDIAPGTPVVTHCHATGLRQMELCPHLIGTVREGCSRNDAFAVLHGGDAERLQSRLEIDAARIHGVGAGYRHDLFHPRGRDPASAPAVLYVGKLSPAKGLPWLLEAFNRIRSRNPSLRLHVAGSGTGAEADALRTKMDHMRPSVIRHGQLTQPELAELARHCTMCVLPSFFEGLPLVLVEALACGCRLVATALPGIREELAPRLGDALTTIPPPRLVSVDQPHADDLPAFVDRLQTAIEAALESPPIGDPEIAIPGALAHFTWHAVFGRIETVWRSLARGSS